MLLSFSHFPNVIGNILFTNDYFDSSFKNENLERKQWNTGASILNKTSGNIHGYAKMAFSLPLQCFLEFIGEVCRVVWKHRQLAIFSIYSTLQHRLHVAITLVFFRWLAISINQEMALMLCDLRRL